MLRLQKEQFVKEMNDIVANQYSTMIIAHYKGLTVSEMSEMRTKARQAGAWVRVSPNKLFKIAVQGTPFEIVSDLFKGATLVVCANDPVAASKVVVEFSKKNDKFAVVGGAVGSERMTSANIKALSELPSMDELRAKLMGVLQAPAQKLLALLQTPSRNFVGTLAAYQRKLEQ